MVLPSIRLLNGRFSLESPIEFSAPSYLLETLTKTQAAQGPPAPVGSPIVSPSAVPVHPEEVPSFPIPVCFEPVSPCAELGSFEDTQACLDEFEPVFHCDEPGPVMEVQASLVGAPCSPPWPVTPPVSEFSPLAPGPPRTSQREKGVPGRANRSLDWRVSQHHPVRAAPESQQPSCEPSVGHVRPRSA